jgi:hypothetical protein
MNATFAGKGAKGDLMATLEKIGMRAGNFGAMQYIEAQILWDFCYMLAFSEEMRWWIRNPVMINPLYDTSLRVIHNFAKPTKMMDKCSKLRNNKSDYGEKRRLIKPEEKFYCAADAEAGRELVMEIAKLLEVPPELFAQQIGGRDNEFITIYGSILKVADAYVLGDTTGLSDDEVTWMKNLLKNADKDEVRVEEVI